jgi:hypothetical protein
MNAVPDRPDTKNAYQLSTGFVFARRCGQIIRRSLEPAQPGVTQDHEKIQDLSSHKNCASYGNNRPNRPTKRHGGRNDRHDPSQQTVNEQHDLHGRLSTLVRKDNDILPANNVFSMDNPKDITGTVLWQRRGAGAALGVAGVSVHSWPHRHRRFARPAAPQCPTGRPCAQAGKGTTALIVGGAHG